MEPGESSNLDQLQELVADLGGPLSSGGGMLGWAIAGDLADVPAEVYRTVGEAGLLADGDPRVAKALRLRTEVDPRLRHEASIPADADALMERLWEVDGDAAIDLLLNLAESNRPRPQRRLRRQPQQDPQDTFAELASLAGPDVRWWTNTDLTRWNPITQHTFDAIIVAAGNGIIVTLIAFDGGE
jgi:hypothetical protein